MRRSRSITLLPVCLLLLLQLAVLSALGQTQHPIELSDIMAWKGINATALSENGEWFGYRIGPAEGESEVVIRQTKGDKEYKFSIGEIPTPPANFGPIDPSSLPATGPAVAFSGDGKYAAFTVYPSRAEAAPGKMAAPRGCGDRLRRGGTLHGANRGELVRNCGRTVDAIREFARLSVLAW